MFDILVIILVVLTLAIMAALIYFQLKELFEEVINCKSEVVKKFTKLLEATV